jgi:hypothetical protein
MNKKKIISSIIKVLIIIVLIVIVVIGGIIGFWYHHHFWTYYFNYRIESVDMREVVLDDSACGGKTYLLTLKCKECNPERRWMGRIPPFANGIAEKVESIEVMDFENKNISSVFQGVDRYKNVPLGFLCVENVTPTVRSVRDLDSLGNYMNHLKEELCYNYYNKRDSSYYVGVLYRLKYNRGVPKDVVVKLKGKTLQAEVDTVPLYLSVSCIIPQGQERAGEAEAIRSSWHYDFDYKK